MKRSRGAYGHSDCLVLIAAAAVAVAIVAPAAVHGAKHAASHGASPVVGAIAGLAIGIGALAALFCLLPLTLAALCAGIARAAHRRRERYRDIVAEYWLNAAGWVLGAVMLAGVCMATYDWLIVPIVRWLRR